MKRRWGPILILLMCPPAMVLGDAGIPSIIPRPSKFEPVPGTFELTSATSIIVASGAEREGRRLAAALRVPTGFALPVVADGPATAGVSLKLDGGLEKTLGREGYRLSITPGRTEICAAAEAGLFYGGITLQQLLPAEIFGPAPRTPVSWRVPCMTIHDAPRFEWRGLLLDCARHFFAPPFVERLMDLMALHKLNTLQLHLTDDQGWRIEIKKYPRLTEVGSIRKESPLAGDRKRGDGTPYGPYFFTREQIRDLVAYAAERHITLVPEIELPGHFLSAVAAYPRLSCTGRPVEVRTRWGIEPDILCPGNDEAVAFACDVLAEVCEVFPGTFIHIGGDEAPRERWKQCEKCQARIRAEGFKGEAQLQTWLNHRLEEFLASKNRRLIGWDEILEGGLTPKAAVMSWRGTAGGIAAATAGHDVVMSPTTHCYLDYGQAKGPAEPECIGGFLPLRKVYEFDPTPAGLGPERQRHILGAQGNIWTEYIRTPRDVEYFAFPRAAALAEVVWSSSQSKDFEDFYRRLEGHLRRLDLLGVNYRRLEKPASAGAGGPGRDIFVDVERGKDGAKGTREDPHRIAQEAVDRAAAGDRIHLLPEGAIVRQAIVLRGKSHITIEGNGVTLTGADPLDAAGWEDLGAGLARRRLPRTPLDRHLLIRDAKAQRMGRSPTVATPFPAPGQLDVGQFAWVPIDEKTGWLYVRGPRENMEWSVRMNAVAIQAGNRDLTIRNIHCRHALNDGFNIHGDSRGLRFEKISGYENFDEGFSAHETSQCRISDGRFWGNDNAAADVGESETAYERCEFSQSVSVDVLFQGGRHAMRDCRVTATGAKAFSITPGILGKEKSRGPVACRLVGCEIRGKSEEMAPFIAADADVNFENCSLENIVFQMRDCRVSETDSTLDGQTLKVP